MRPAELGYAMPAEWASHAVIVPLTFQTPSLHRSTFSGAGMLTCCPSSTPFGLD